MVLLEIGEKVTGISSRALLEELFIMDIMATPNEEGDGCTSQWIFGSAFPTKLKNGMAHY